MKEVSQLISEISALRVYLRKASEATDNRTRQRYNTEVDYHYMQVLELFEDEDVTNRLDSMLSSLSEIAASNENIETAIQMLNDERQRKQFISAEMQLSTMMKSSRSDIVNLLDISKRFLYLVQRQDHSSIVPKNTMQFRELFIKATEHTIELSRRYSGGNRKNLKKLAKKEANKNFRLFAMGTTLALGDMVLEAGSAGFATPVAISSMVIGVLASGSAQFNDPDILKLISQALNSNVTNSKVTETEESEEKESEEAEDDVKDETN